MRPLEPQSRQYADLAGLLEFGDLAVFLADYLVPGFDALFELTQAGLDSAVSSSSNEAVNALPEPVGAAVKAAAIRVFTSFDSRMSVFFWLLVLLGEDELPLTGDLQAIGFALMLDFDTVVAAKEFGRAQARYAAARCRGRYVCCLGAVLVHRCLWPHSSS